MANSEQLRKLFVGGLTRDSDEKSLRDTFSLYGTIVEVSVLRDAQQRSRGFGFVVFDDSACVDAIIKAKKEGQVIMVDNIHVEVKRALPRVERGEARDRFTSRQSGIKKTFVGGLTSTTTAADLEDYFSKFGKVVDSVVMMDKTTNKSRGFGFVTFDDEDSADKVCALKSHEINSKLCEVRKAEPRVNFNNRRERDQLQPQMGRYPSEPPMQQRLPNAGIDPGNLNSAVQVLSSLQTLLSATQLQQPYVQPNQMANLNQGHFQPAPLQNQVASNTNQSNNVLQLLQSALSGAGLQNATQNNPSAASAQPNNQLGLLLNALGGSNASNVGGTSSFGQQGLSNLGLLGQLSGQNTAGGVKTESMNNGYGMQGSSSVSGSDLSNQATTQGTSYYEDDYGAHSQSSSGYGPVRYPPARTDTKPNAYRPY